MNRTDNLLAELQRLAGLPDQHGGLDSHLQELTSAAARLLRARSCTFQWLREEQSALDEDAALSSTSADDATNGEVSFRRAAIEGQTKSIRDSAEQSVVSAPLGADNPEGSTLSSTITAGGRVIGVVQVSGPLDRPSFDGDDLRLLDIVTVYIGKSLQAAQLRSILHSRFTQIALAQSVDKTVGEVLAAVPHPAQIVRILARSFYREMTKAGFGTNEMSCVNSAPQNEMFSLVT